jgi:hypothetical protein
MDTGHGHKKGIKSSLAQINPNLGWPPGKGDDDKLPARGELLALAVTLNHPTSDFARQYNTV